MNDSELLVWLEPSASERVFIHGTCSIGRALSNHLPLPAEKVSRRHALIHAQDNDEFWLVDLGSSNGTCLNGRRVIQPVLLHDQDKIDICGFQIVFHQEVRPALPADHALDPGATVHEVKSATCWMLVADIEGSTQLLKARSADELAAITGRWLAECKQIIEESGGGINKFLGDGFFAYWHDRERIVVSVARALETLKRLQAGGQPRFRVVVHYGPVFTGAGASLGEESLLGPEVNFVFRMEKLAGQLGNSRVASHAAAGHLMSCIPITDLGRHPLSSFDGDFMFHSF